MKISVAIATYNEEANVGACLTTVKSLADEIVVVDGSSTDKTREIVEGFGARVIVTNNPPIFHINKQKALAACQGEWILQLDADERITPALAREIKKVVKMTEKEQEQYQKRLNRKKLFTRHQRLVEERDGRIGSDKKDYAGFFVPRLNYFLGKYLRYGGVYPDGVIRLVKNGQAHFPAKDVHEQIVIDGRVGWLDNDLIHLADVTFAKYLRRNSKYIDLLAEDFKYKKIPKNLVEGLRYLVWRPVWWFLLVTICHKGILDGFPGLIFALFSALRFPRAYWRYLRNK
jgi:glycosyltransferase involved in cell wall biosynthesis